MEQVQLLRSVCDTNVPGGKRDLAILDSMLYQGMRLSEMANLRIQDIRYSEDKFYVHIKRRPKPVKAHPNWLQSLNNWLDQRGVSLKKKLGPVSVQITKFVKDPIKLLGHTHDQLHGRTILKFSGYRADEGSNQAYFSGFAPHLCKDRV